MTADPHSIELRPDGWSLLCPVDCGPSCPVVAAAEVGVSPPPAYASTGRHPCWAEDGRLVVAYDVQVYDGVDRVDPTTASRLPMETFVNRLGSDPLDPAARRAGFSPWGSEL